MSYTVIKSIADVTITSQSLFEVSGTVVVEEFFGVVTASMDTTPQLVVSVRSIGAEHWFANDLTVPTGQRIEPGAIWGTFEGEQGGFQNASPIGPLVWDEHGWPQVSVYKVGGPTTAGAMDWILRYRPVTPGSFVTVL